MKTQTSEKTQKTQKPPFVLITAENISRVARELADKKGGSVIIASQVYLSGMPEIYFYNVPRIDLQNNLLRGTERGTKTVNGRTFQTGWENDRLWRLGKILKGSGDDSIMGALHETFSEIILGDKYRFGVRLQPCPSYSLLNKHELAVYVPKNASLADALKYVFGHVIGKLNICISQGGVDSFHFTDAHVMAMVDYASQDLKDGKALEHNIRAGAEAEAVLLDSGC